MMMSQYPEEDYDLTLTVKRMRHNTVHVTVWVNEEKRFSLKILHASVPLKYLEIKIINMCAICIYNPTIH